MKRGIALILFFCLLLGGCSNLLDGSYVSVEPHEAPGDQTETEIVSVGTYGALLNAICALVEDGSQTGTISLSRYSQNQIAMDMETAVDYVMQQHPIGAYAVAEIYYDLGTYAGQPAAALTITYLHDRSEIRKIQRPADWKEAEAAIAEALDNCEAGLVLYLEDYVEMDFTQWVYHYTNANPDKVMELPGVTANIYPENGDQRVVELKFTYQNSRDTLRSMQGTVEKYFSAAAIYADGEEDAWERFNKLSSFMMGLTTDLQQQTSITPAYSLLQHGVGDSRAFATVYAAMCVRAELECIVVTGTKSGEPWYWNIIGRDGVYYHLDLVECNGSGTFAPKTDVDMSGYVWDYSAYPACGATPDQQNHK